MVVAHSNLILSSEKWLAVVRTWIVLHKRGEFLEQLLKYLFLRTVAVQCACPRTYRLLSLLSCRRGCDNMQATWIFSLPSLVK